MGWDDNWRELLRQYASANSLQDMAAREYERMRDEAMRPWLASSSIAQIVEDQMRARELALLSSARASYGDIASLGVKNVLDQLADQKWMHSQLAQMAIAGHMGMPDFESHHIARLFKDGASLLASSGAQSALAAALSFVDFDEIQRAALGASSRILDNFTDYLPTSAEDLESAIDDADVGDELTDAIQKAVEVALENYEKRNRIKLGRVTAAITLFLLAALVESILQSLLTPYIERWFPPAKPAGDERQEVPQIQSNLPSASFRVVVTTKIAAVRQGPRGSYPLIGTIPKNQILRVDKRRHGWVRVLYVIPASDGATVKGWIRVRSTKPVELEVRRLLIQAMASKGIDTEE